jgi:hypothetical protein
MESFPSDGLYVDKLNELASKARRLIQAEPDLAAPFMLIWLGFAAIASRWEDVPLDPMLSDLVSPRLIVAVRSALDAPTPLSLNGLAQTLYWAYAHGLILGT